MAIASPIQRGDHGEETAPVGRVTFDDLWEHHDYLHAVSRRIVGDASTAEDIVQETYVRALRHLDELDSGRPLRAWLTTVARRCSIDELRRQGRHAVPVDSVPELGRNTLHVLTEALVQRDALVSAREALDLLQPRERRLLLARAAGETVASIAAEEGSTSRAVESVISRARAKLTAAVERGAAMVFVPAAPLVRRLREAWLRAGMRLRPSARDQAVLGARSGELVAGLTAAAVMAAALVVGTRGDASSVRVDAGARTPKVSLGWFGPDGADPAATLDRAALRRAAQVLTAPLGEILGLPDLGDDPRDEDGGPSWNNDEPRVPSPRDAGSSDAIASGPGGGSGAGGHRGGSGGGGNKGDKDNGTKDRNGPGGGEEPPGSHEPPPGPMLNLNVPLASTSLISAGAHGSDGATQVSLPETRSENPSPDPEPDPEPDPDPHPDPPPPPPPPPPGGGGSFCWHPAGVCDIEEVLDRPTMRQL